jgi:hypothetical protein
MPKISRFFSGRIALEKINTAFQTERQIWEEANSTFAMDTSILPM